LKAFQGFVELPLALYASQVCGLQEFTKKRIKAFY